MGFPVECTLVYNENDPRTHDVRQQIFRIGEVRYDPRSRDGRRIVMFATREMQEEAISKNPAGSVPMFVIPSDIVSDETETAIRRIVREELQAAGIDVPERMQPASATNQAIGLARKYGLDLTKITGTGENGQIGKADVEKVIATQ